YPIVRRRISSHLSLLGVVSIAAVLFFLQFGRHIYLIVENDLSTITFEKQFFMGFLMFLMGYAILYLLFRGLGRGKMWFFAIPSIIAAGLIIFQTYQVLYVAETLRFFHTLIENAAIEFFLLHLLAGAFLFLASADREERQKEGISLSFIGVIALGVMAYFMFMGQVQDAMREHVWFLANLLMFFPLIHASLRQLQFGKVSLVITQSLQYLIAFVFSLILYLLISQVYGYLRLNIEYRRILEFVTFLVALGIIRLVYNLNEDKLSRYFVSTQQERLAEIRSFIARISQYTSPEVLIEDLKRELQVFFSTDFVEFWWSPEEFEVEGEGATDVPEIAGDVPWDRIYHQLEQRNTIWSKTKVISTFRLEKEEEKQLSQTPVHLLSTITVDEGRYALLQLGKKKRGVYNLSDLELISQLIQQTQLTLNVLSLLSREKDLIQQTYEANLTALRSQINPHFLFNTLNSIGELVHESADLAEQAVEKLAFIFRYTLNKSSENYVALGEEMKLIRTYLEMEKIRFGERLEMHIEINDHMQDVQIPSFVLLTLVENTIKHGVSKILHKGKVSVVAFKDDNFLVCEVMDNGPGIDTSRIFKSHGLSNTVSRMENTYDMKDLMYFENTGDGT
ncbi:MAG: histidine kinase, partial [Bacteroidota bacterium]